MSQSTEQSIRQIFKELPQNQPSAGLEQKILKAIASEKQAKIRRQLFLVDFGMAISSLAVIVAGLYFGSSLVNSQFWNLASLLFSDAGIVLNNWYNFILSLLETLPVFDLIGLLVPVLALLVSVSLYFNISRQKNCLLAN